MSDAIESIECEDGSVADRFNKLTQVEKLIVIGVGTEAIGKVMQIQQLGHTTLRGHCMYVRPKSPSLIEQMLLALNGDKNARKMLVDFAMSSELRSIHTNIRGL